ncbi:bifunctional DNA primase/polymerase [Streptomyces lydicus]|uniref:bifunctional DNA primase/polymerase n=1 Tax=Streptomyces lydicus TaxID=47763 RepID=UPI0005266A1B|nr:bifunctional DNA primase/polymerase [Streptomyces lydicus]MDC7338859.1 hypothetical protein [Streptomyces lydicus]UEG91661.1 hypothetical protein LJ741_14515 [Streptomyces lydicus]
MSDWLPETPRTPDFPTTSYVTLAGADWLASAAPRPDELHALWALRPAAPSVLPCGTAFDVINVPALFGRRMVDRLWSDGPGSGPVAAHRGRLLLFAAPGTAQRLPALLVWEEWAAAVPPLLYHGTGDAVTVPPLHPHPGTGTAGARPAYTDTPSAYGAPDAPSGDPADLASPSTSRWLVAPDVRKPWLPGPDVLLWACVRAARPVAGVKREAAAQPPVSALAQG